MKIAIIGYGKMGHRIEHFAKERGHEIVAVIDKENQTDFDSEAFASADVAIEFTTPSTALQNCLTALKRGVSVVSGSTGWKDSLPEVRELCATLPETAFIWSSNYSIGVNLFFAINAYAAKLMGKFGQYHPAMKEIHHIHKLDHPSGTAISLAEAIIENAPEVTAWSEEPGGDHTLVIDHEREGEVPGTHIVTWDSPVDAITLEHRAKSRDGFALGAVVAAEWLAAQRGYHTMSDLMAALLGE